MCVGVDSGRPPFLVLSGIITIITFLYFALLSLILIFSFFIYNRTKNNVWKELGNIAIYNSLAILLFIIVNILLNIFYWR